MIRRPPRSTPFPTRRSSDLPAGLRDHRQGAQDHDAESRGARQRANQGLAGNADADRLREGLREAHAAGGIPQDRKSTRLNSSHGYISYAVFCLKKKNYTALCLGYRAPYLFRHTVSHGGSLASADVNVSLISSEACSWLRLLISQTRHCS